MNALRPHHPDAELLELGRAFDAATAVADRYDREIQKPASRALEAKVAPRPDEGSPGYPAWSARWKAAYASDLVPIEQEGDRLEDAVTEIAERIAEHEPETLEGLAVSLRALRRIEPELWGRLRRVACINRFAGTVIDAAVRLADIRQADPDNSNRRALGVALASSPEPDPIFAAIDAHRAAMAASTEATRARAKAEAKIGMPDWPVGWMLDDELKVRWKGDAALQAAIARSVETMEAEEDAFRAMLSAAAATEAGRMVLLHYACVLERPNGPPCSGAGPAYRIAAALVGIREENAEPEDD
jgi:hypothetical protein